MIASMIEVFDYYRRWKAFEFHQRLFGSRLCLMHLQFSNITWNSELGKYGNKMRKICSLYIRSICQMCSSYSPFYIFILFLRWIKSPIYASLFLEFGGIRSRDLVLCRTLHFCRLSSKCIIIYSLAIVRFRSTRKLLKLRRFLTVSNRE